MQNTTVRENNSVWYNMPSWHGPNWGDLLSDKSPRHPHPLPAHDDTWAFRVHRTIIICLPRCFVIKFFSSVKETFNEDMYHSQTIRQCTFCIKSNICFKSSACNKKRISFMSIRFTNTKHKSFQMLPGFCIITTRTWTTILLMENA